MKQCSNTKKTSCNSVSTLWNICSTPTGQPIYIFNHAQQRKQSLSSRDTMLLHTSVVRHENYNTDMLDLYWSALSLFTRYTYWLFHWPVGWKININNTGADLLSQPDETGFCTKEWVLLKHRLSTVNGAKTISKALSNICHSASVSQSNWEVDLSSNQISLRLVWSDLLK